MSNQCQTVTLQTAVQLQVKEFAANNKPFSVHDITREVRQKTANGVLEIPEVEVSGASIRFDIPHTKVKALFDEMWRAGVFDPDFSLNRQFVKGMYFEYTPSLVTPFAASAPAPSFSVAQPTQTYAAPKVTFPANKSVEDRILNYLANCEARSFQPTLKQVQSAIKRDVSTGWSCEKIQDYIEGAGYKVVADPDYVSASQVVL